MSGQVSEGTFLSRAATHGGAACSLHKGSLAGGGALPRHPPVFGSAPRKDPLSLLSAGAEKEALWALRAPLAWHGPAHGHLRDETAP